MVKPKLVLSVGAAVLLSGCVIGGNSASLTYRAGYSDGCSAQRDEELYRVDPDYRAGWTSGRASCAGRS
jgi:hypothetical protein